MSPIPEIMEKTTNRFLISLWGGSLLGLAIHGELIQNPALRIGLGLIGGAAISATIFYDNPNEQNKLPEDMDNRGKV